MKTDDSIRHITLAAIHRHSIDIDKWTRTTMCPVKFPANITPLENELPVVQFFIDNDNWTLVTTRRVIGTVNAILQQLSFSELDGYTWGLIKNQKADHTLFRLTDIYGEQLDFLLETGNPSMGVIYAIKTIDGLRMAGT